MAVLYSKTKWDFHTEGPSLTEQEHLDSCDINKMIKNVMRGMDVRGSNPSSYGYDDTTMDGLTFRIQKQQLEEQLSSGEKEFTQEQLDLIPKSIQEKFGFKLKEQTQATSTTIQTTTNSPTSSQNNEPPTTPATPS